MLVILDGIRDSLFDMKNMSRVCDLLMKLPDTGQQNHVIRITAPRDMKREIPHENHVQYRSARTRRAKIT